ncbi:MAG: hypothetical protein B6I34_11305 [Anaerolineaceae bacterium 4572_32.1]|nr:MAG: hypothetical protein B6I34_11305 [Anaerolineaceae bacterium 4572_32.1]
MRARWQSTLDHPMLRLELRRIRRVRWWPGRRFFLFYPVVLGATLGCGAIVALSAGLSNLSVPVRFLEPGGIQMAALVTGVPVICLVGTATTLLSVALPWIAPALTSATIARERELGTLDLLLTTLLTERSIVLGKLGGCLARLWPGILALALLTPFQLVGTSLLGGYSSTIGMVALGAKQPWLWLLLEKIYQFLSMKRFATTEGEFRIETLATIIPLTLSPPCGQKVSIRFLLSSNISLCWSKNCGDACAARGRSLC